MSVNLKLIDDQFPLKEITHTRMIARGLVLNESNQIAFCYLERDDIFGLNSYIETPGGGIEPGEEIEKGLVREIDEELGYECEIIEKLGVVEDYYNLINRKNINNYFLCRIGDILSPLILKE